MNLVDEKVLLALCPDPVIGVDGQGTVQIFNAAAEKLLGYSAESIINSRNITEIYPNREAARSIKRLMYSNEYGDVGSIEGYETHLINNQGREVPVRLSAAIANHESGCSIGFFHDLTERLNLEKQLHKLSITDELTGLYNQRHFYRVLTQELERAHRYGSELSLICFDLDSFKTINDSMGHLEGDRALKVVGELLLGLLRSNDVAVRYGGDEFMVLLPQTDIQSAFKTAERIKELFNQQCPFSCDNAEKGMAEVALSLGVTSTNGHEKPDQVVQRADLAMYEAKSSGGNNTVQIEQVLKSALASVGS